MMGFKILITIRYVQWITSDMLTHVRLYIETSFDNYKYKNQFIIQNMLFIILVIYHKIPL